MKLTRLAVAVGLAVIAFDIGRALATHDGVGAVEWVVGLALVVLLALAAVRNGLKFARRA
jgi:uncharacterized membrane protein